MQHLVSLRHDWEFDGWPANPHGTARALPRVTRA